MATRTCGRTKINCSYRDRQGDYRCALSVDGKARGTQYVGVPASSRSAVDSAAAYDGAARAAVSFALNEGMLEDRDVDFASTGTGYIIHRGGAKARRR